jgi:hypothetical protein
MDSVEGGLVPAGRVVVVVVVVVVVEGLSVLAVQQTVYSVALAGLLVVLLVEYQGEVKSQLDEGHY